MKRITRTTRAELVDAIRVLNGSGSKHPQTRRRPSLYDEAVRGALIVLWEASDRVCGKRLKALLPVRVLSLSCRECADLIVFGSATLDAAGR